MHHSYEHSELVVPSELVLQVLASLVPPDATPDQTDSDDEQYEDDSDSAAIAALVLFEGRGIVAA